MAPVTSLGYVTSRSTVPQPAPLTYPVPAPYTAPTATPFTGTAPTAQPFGTFTGPNPAAVASDPYYQFRLQQGNQAIQRSAAARGTLLNGGTLKSLANYSQGLASEEGQNAFNRALESYNANRATAAQNFGENMDTYQGNLAGYNANTSAALGYGRLGLEGEQNQFGQNRQVGLDAQGNQQATNDYNAWLQTQWNPQPAADNSANNAATAAAYQAQADADYQRQLEDTQRQNAAISAVRPARPGMLGRRMMAGAT